MRLRSNTTPAALLTAIAVVVGLTACGSADAGGDTVAPSVPAVVTVPTSTAAPTTTAPSTTVPSVPTTTAVATTEAPTTTDNILVVTDAEVADLEQQLDEIDQLLAGVDADLAQD